MAVGVLSRNSSQSEIETTHPNMTRQRRNGMAYIFHGQSSQDITYLKECFTKRLESTSSESDFETETESDVEMEAMIDALRDIEQKIDAEHKIEESGSTESVESECAGLSAVQRSRRVALADIFDGIPEDQVSEFLSQYSNIDNDDTMTSEHEELITLANKTRRNAMSDIFQGIPKDSVNDLLERFQDCDSVKDTCNSHSPNQNYLCHRRGALADIFQGGMTEELRTRLFQCSPEESCSGSDESENPIESDGSDVQMNGHGSDSSLPDETYLWRRRCAKANIFEGISTTENHFRAQ